MAKSSLPTVIAVAVIAYAASDTVHELVGHGLTAVLLGIRVTSISTVGLQSAESGRLLSASGSIANVVVGAIVFALLSRRKSFDTVAYFLWLFGFVNLMNGTCYLIASALLNNSDWAVVIAGLHPAWAWRGGLGIVGSMLYFLSIRWAASLARFGTAEAWKLTVPAYLAGGVLMTLASVFNPFSASLILLSGAGASFGLTWGLLLIPGKTDFQSLPFRWAWIIAGTVMGIVFVAVLGPGLRFR